MTELSFVVILLISGACVGFASGLLGVGGAFILTPIQFEIYLRMGLPEDIALLTAFGTSLLVVLPTAISGIWWHRYNKTVNWKAALIIGITSMIFSLLGASIANLIP